MIRQLQSELYSLITILSSFQPFTRKTSRFMTHRILRSQRSSSSSPMRLLKMNTPLSSEPSLTPMVPVQVLISPLARLIWMPTMAKSSEFSSRAKLLSFLLLLFSSLVPKAIPDHQSLVLIKQPVLNRPDSIASISAIMITPPSTH